MKTQPYSFFALLSTAILIEGVLCQTSQAQGLLNISGTSTLAPSLTPIGGYGASPQEYLSVSWSVVENPSGIYLYSYTVHNPVGDVLMNPSGGLTSTPEIFDSLAVDFNTTVAGEYLPGTQTGGSFQLVNTVDLAWFFNPAVAAGSSAPTVTFQSDFPPTSGNASADGAIPWSSVSPNGQELAVPDPPSAVPEPSSAALVAMAGLLFVPVGLATRKNSIRVG